MQFSLKRCLHLIRLQLVMNRRLHLYTLLTVAGLMLAYMMYYVFAVPFGLQWEMQDRIAFEGAMLFMLVSSGYYWQLGRTSARLRAFMLPVSTLERTIGAFVMILGLYLAAYLLIFLFCNTLCYLIGNFLLHQGNRYAYILDGDRFPMLFVAGFMMVAIGLAAGLTFRKLPVVKAVCIVALIFIVVNSGGGLLAKTLIEREPQRHYVIPYNGEEILVKDQFFRASFDQWIIKPVTTTGDTADLQTVQRPAWLKTLADITACSVPFLLICYIWFKMRESTL
ncbi:hypothetical protein ACQKLP_03895 [Chitinophaga sp. NPDC101104]|uniref:hypothetical protein n=1 Tax=Chitinophaga sp. NPDC101104 TaxID=3390561 RepID=UPI003CFD090C